MAKMKYPSSCIVFLLFSGNVYVYLCLCIYVMGICVTVYKDNCMDLCVCECVPNMPEFKLFIPFFPVSFLLSKIILYYFIHFLPSVTCLLISKFFLDFLPFASYNCLQNKTSLRMWKCLEIIKGKKKFRITFEW